MNIKKLTSILLSALLVVTILPLSNKAIYAQEGETQVENVNEEVAQINESAEEENKEVNQEANPEESGEVIIEELKEEITSETKEDTSIKEDSTEALEEKKEESALEETAIDETKKEESAIEESKTLEGEVENKEVGEVENKEAATKETTPESLTEENSFETTQEANEAKPAIKSVAAPKTAAVGAILSYVDWGNTTSFTYDGKSHAVSVDGKIGVNITNRTYSGIDGTSYEPSTVKPVDAGTYLAEVEYTYYASFKQKVGTATKEFTIKPRKLTYEEESSTYNGEDQQLSNITINGFVSGQGATATVALHEALEAKNVGEYTYNVTLIQNDGTNLNNYTFDETFKQTITKKDVSFVWNDSNNEDHTYKASAFAPLTADISLCPGDVINYDVIGEPKPINAGKYTYYIDNIVGDCKDNYNFKNISEDFTINKKEISIKWEDNDNDKLIYNGEPQHPSLDLAEGSLAGEDKIEDAVSFSYGLLGLGVADKGIDAGVHKVTVKALDNYKLHNYGTKFVPIYNDEKTYTIKKRPITVGWDENTLSFEYDNKAHAPSYEVISELGIIEGDEDDIVTISTWKNGILRVADDANTYSALMTSKDNDNYNVTIENKTTSFEITKRPITIQVGLETIYNSYQQWPTLEVVSEKDIASGDVLAKIVNPVIFDKKHVLLENHVYAGDYHLELVDSTKANNYDCTFINQNKEPIGQTDLIFTIKKKQLTVNWGVTSFVYKDSTNAIEDVFGVPISIKNDNNEDIYFYHPTAKLDKGEVCAHDFDMHFAEIAIVTWPKKDIGTYTAKVELFTPGTVWDDVIESRKLYRNHSNYIGWGHAKAAQQRQEVLDSYELANPTTTFYIYAPDTEEIETEGEGTGGITTGVVNKVDESVAEKIAMEPVDSSEALEILKANVKDPEDKNDPIVKILEQFEGDAGKNIHISTVVQDVPVPEQGSLEREEYDFAMQTFANQGLVEGDNAMFLDISLYASVDGESMDPVKLTETGKTTITITIDLDIDQAKAIGIEGEGSDRIVKICRCHEGSYTIFNGSLTTVKNDQGEITGYKVTFETDRFSEYAIYTVAKQSRPTVLPVTGVDERKDYTVLKNTFALISMLLVACYSIISALRQKKETY